jgi:hypothetical protein
LLEKIILLLVSYYYLKQGLYPLLTGKPAIKSDVIKKIVIVLIMLELFLLLFSLFHWLTALYGLSYGGITVGTLPFYLLLFLFCLLILWIFYRRESDSDILQQSVALVAVHPEYVLAAARETFAQMEINYRETAGGFELVENEFMMSVKISRRQVRFSVNRPLDRIFLKQFCRIYQTLYKQQYPIKRSFALLSMALGLAVLVILAFILLDYLILIKNAITQFSALRNGMLNKY